MLKGLEENLKHEPIMLNIPLRCDDLGKFLSARIVNHLIQVTS